MGGGMRDFAILALVSLSLLATTVLAVKTPSGDFKQEENKRQKRLLSIFNVVRFKNQACSSTMVNNGHARNGTCFSNEDCEKNKGTVAGNCASGFGVCCVFIKTASASTIDQNCTYIQNVGFPSALTTTSDVTYTINRCSHDVCYLRLDFETFMTAGPAGTTELAAAHTCQDQFTVTAPPAQVIPTICGSNAGQHMYIDIGNRDGDTATLKFAFLATAAGATRMWDIKVSQITCHAGTHLPPHGCLQYHEELTGRFTTFNFIPTAGAGAGHLSRHDYDICIRSHRGYCCTEYRVCSDQADAFTLGRGVAGTAAAIAGTSAAGQDQALRDNNCEDDDYVLINEGSQTCQMGTGQLGRGRFCGGFLGEFTGSTINSPICDCTAPFIVGIRTNTLADNQLPNANAAIAPANTANNAFSRGICLDYRQVPCGN